MARKRFITSDMCTDKKMAMLAEENPTTALMWPWFVTCFDDWGRMGAEPMEVKLTVFPAFPFTSKDIAEAIKLYDQYELAHYYEVNNKPYLAVNPETWYKYQTYIESKRKEKQASKFPAPLNPTWTEQNQQQLATIADNQQQLATIVPSPSLTPSLTPKDIKESSSEPSGSDLPPEENKKSGIKPFPTESTEYRLSALLRQRILENDPNARVPTPTPEGMVRWCRDMDLLLRKDNRDPCEAEQIINWCQNDNFWKANILSAGKLREKYTALILQSKRGSPNAKSLQPTGSDTANIDFGKFMYQPKNLSVS